MSYRATYLLFFILALNGCTNKGTPDLPGDWQAYSTQMFSFQGPPGLQKQNVHGIGSYLGQFKAPGIDLNFDYGPYADPLEDSKRNQEGYSVQFTKVDGRNARIVSYADNKASDGLQYCAGIHFAGTGDRDNKLTVIVRCKGKEDLARLHQLLRTIRLGDPQ